MRTIFSFAFLSFFKIALFAQNTVPVVFYIDDADSHREVVGALVSIKQTGYNTKPTGGGGRVSFDNVPVGEIEYNISKEGYQFKSDRENVSSEIKSNTFRVSLQKIPSPDDKKILVTGEVTDADGNELKDAWVEVKIADVERTVTTNESGNYTLDITPNSKFPATSMRIEVKKGTCKKTEVIDLNRTNMVYKDFKLDCGGGKTSSGEGKDIVKEKTIGPLGEKTLNGIKMTIDRFEQRGSTATFYFTLENMTAATSIRETGVAGYNASQLIDQDGNSFPSNYASVGNTQGYNDWAQVKLIYSTPVKGSIQFDVNAVQVKKAALLKVVLSGYGSIELINLNLK